jgi:hypothetical protein
LVEALVSWFDRWTTALKALPPSFQDPITTSSPEVQNLILGRLEEDITRLKLIVGREYGYPRVGRPEVITSVTAGQMQQAPTSLLELAYDPPGTLRDGGHLAMITISPTYGTFALRRPMKNLPVRFHHIFPYFFQWHHIIYLRVQWNGILTYSSGS